MAAVDSRKVAERLYAVTASVRKRALPLQFSDSAVCRLINHPSLIPYLERHALETQLFKNYLHVGLQVHRFHSKCSLRNTMRKSHKRGRFCTVASICDDATRMYKVKGTLLRGFGARSSTHTIELVLKRERMLHEERVHGSCDEILFERNRRYLPGYSKNSKALLVKDRYASNPTTSAPAALPSCGRLQIVKRT